MRNDLKKYGPRADDAGDISRSIATTFIYLESIDRRALAAMTPSLTTAQYHALAAIDADPGGTLGALAGRMLCDKANASGIVDRLAAMRLVDRRRDPGDRRRVALNLTSAGQGALAEAHQRRIDALCNALESLGSEQLAGALAHLRTLISALAATSDERALSPASDERAHAS